MAETPEGWGSSLPPAAQLSLFPSGTNSPSTPPDGLEPPPVADLTHCQSASRNRNTATPLKVWFVEISVSNAEMRFLLSFVSIIKPCPSELAFC